MIKIKDGFCNLIKWIREVNYRHFVACFLVAFSVFLALTRYELSYIRFAQNLSDLWNSVILYITQILFGIEDMDEVIVIIDIYDIDINKVFSFDIYEFLEKWDLYGEYLTSYKNFLNYCIFVLSYGSLAASVFALILPILILVSKFVKRSYLSPGSIHDMYSDTDELSFFKCYFVPRIVNIYYWCVSFIDFMKENRYYVKILLVVWLFNLNLISIAFGLVAYYLFIISSFNVSTFPDAVIKLIIDLLITVNGASLLLWGILIYAVILNRLKELAYFILEHHEMKNRGFINSCPVCVMNCGTMGSGKTSAAVDMALSTSIMHKDKALDIMVKWDMRFPNFPWLRFENDLKKCYIKHLMRKEGADIDVSETIFNLASSKLWVLKQRDKYLLEPTMANLWEYDINLYKSEYDTDLVIVDLFEALIIYSKAYLIYVAETSLIFGNISVREDIESDESAFLKLWNTDFFRRSPYESERASRFAHIFDFDMFRLGKKMVEDNKNSMAFEFGVVVLSEIGKERKNNLENRELKKKSEECNQNNDLFNTSLKMIRHRATVDNYCFVRILTDEQRPESWGADARDVCSVLNIAEKTELKVLYKGLFFDGFIHDIIYPKFHDFYLKMRNLRGDNTLLVYLLKNMNSFFECRYERLENRFGYYELSIEMQSGTLDGEKKTISYYLSRKKAYSGRYSTDCYFGFFEPMAAKSGISLYEFVTYRSIQQERDEMQLQNSFFISDMSKYTNL